MQTYTALYHNEERALSIKIRDNDECAFVPSEVWVTITSIDGNGNNRDRQVASIKNDDEGNPINIAMTIIGSTITANIGDYYIKWEIIKDSYTYFHRTKLEILPI